MGPLRASVLAARSPPASRLARRPSRVVSRSQPISPLTPGVACPCHLLTTQAECDRWLVVLQLASTASGGLCLRDTAEMMLSERPEDARPRSADSGAHADAHPSMSGALAVLGIHHGPGLRLIRSTSSSGADESAGGAASTGAGGASGVMAWQLRWVVLDSGRLLSYSARPMGGFARGGRPAELLESYSLSDLSEVSPQSEHGDCCLTIRLLHTDGTPHTLHLKAASCMQRDLWIASVLESALLSTTTDDADHNVADEALIDIRLSCSGDSAHPDAASHSQDAHAARPARRSLGGRPARRDSLRTSLVISPGGLSDARAAAAGAAMGAVAHVPVAVADMAPPPPVRKAMGCLSCCLPPRPRGTGVAVEGGLLQQDAARIQHEGSAMGGGLGGGLGSGLGGGLGGGSFADDDAVGEWASVPVTVAISSGARKGGKGFKWRCEVCIGLAPDQLSTASPRVSRPDDAREESADHEPLSLKVSHTWASSVLIRSHTFSYVLIRSHR